jgi:SAM-dependent methyltransferase
MIRDYPNCVYHGCDIVDATRKLLRCDQFHFSYGNVVKGLPYADDTFDFVHMRLLVYALRAEEWPMAIQEVIRVVRPGGMIQLYEGGLEVYVATLRSAGHELNYG